MHFQSGSNFSAAAAALRPASWTLESRIAAGFDIDRRAIEAYEYNHAHRGSRGFVLDLTLSSPSRANSCLQQLAFRKLMSWIRRSALSAVWTSLANVAGAQTIGRVSCSISCDLQANCARGRYSSKNSPTWQRSRKGDCSKRWIPDLIKLGYAVRTDVIPAADFGVPQIRQCCSLLVAARGVARIELPSPSHGARNLLGGALKPYVTAREALDSLPLAGDFGECGVHNHEPTEHSADMLARFATLGAGEREREIIPRPASS